MIVIQHESTFAQAEGNCWLNLRFGGTHISIGPAKQFRERKRRSKWSPFPFRFEFWRPISHCGMREVFRIGCNWLSLSYTTKGESEPGHYRWDEVGFRFRIAQ